MAGHQEDASAEWCPQRFGFRVHGDAWQIDVSKVRLCQTGSPHKNRYETRLPESTLKPCRSRRINKSVYSTT